MSKILADRIAFRNRLRSLYGIMRAHGVSHNEIRDFFRSALRK